MSRGRGAVAALAAVAILAACDRAPSRRPPPEPPALPSAAAPAPEPPPRRAGRPAARIDRAWLDSAKRMMGEPAEGRCGPYLLFTDASGDGERRLCRLIGAQLDTVYRERFGLEPVGEPAGAVLLFARRDAFRRWAADTAGLRAGYAGFSRASRGIVALPVDGELLATTLAHELTHLVNRRALGFDVPPWLAEGLADAVGDAVGGDGLVDLVGIRGVEGQARRLAVALAAEEPPRLARLVALDRGAFDRRVPSYDYEQSALFVRMLLLEADLAPAFRRFLAALAAGEPYEPVGLRRRLGHGWGELDRRLAAWLERELSPRRATL